MLELEDVLLEVVHGQTALLRHHHLLDALLAVQERSPARVLRHADTC